MARGDDFQVILTYSQVRELLTAVQQVPCLMAKIDALTAQANALRSMYTECLDKLAELQKSI